MILTYLSVGKWHVANRSSIYSNYSCCMDRELLNLEVIYHLQPAEERITKDRHCIVLLEDDENQNELARVWVDDSKLLEPWKVKGVFALTPKPCDDCKYRLMYFNKEGHILETSGSLQLLRGKLSPNDDSETNLPRGNASVRFEMVPEQKYPDTTDDGDLNHKKKPLIESAAKSSMSNNFHCNLVGSTTWTMSWATDDKEKPVTTKDCMLIKWRKKVLVLLMILENIFKMTNDKGDAKGLPVELKKFFNLCEELQREILGTCKCINKEYDVLIQYYQKFCSVIRDVNEIAIHCVTKKIIPPEYVTELHNIKNPSGQVSMLLNRITGPVAAGSSQGFFDLLDIMEKYGVQATQSLAVKVKRSLEMKSIDGIKQGDDELMELNQHLCDREYKLTHSRMSGDHSDRAAVHKLQGVRDDMEQLLKGTRYIAMYDYTAQKHDEISFKKGDIFLYPEFCGEDGWMIGSIEHSGNRGMFPLNHVKRIT